MINARLVKISEMSALDFAMSDEEFETLKSFQGSVVTIVSTATDGYFDIITNDGSKYDAISAYHLKHLPN